MAENSTRPYLIRAIYDWANDNSLTPFVLVDTRGEGVIVPEQFIKDNSIVLNISAGAVQDLNIGDEFISFSARFAGKAQEVFVPVQNVRAVYAKENGEGIVLPEGGLPGGVSEGLIDGVHNEPSAEPLKDIDKTLSLTTVKTNGLSEKVEGTVTESAEHQRKSDQDGPKKPRPTLTIVE